MGKEKLWMSRTNGVMDVGTSIDVIKEKFLTIECHYNSRMPNHMGFR